MSPLPWRANVTLAVIVLGAPAALLVLREESTIGPARLLGGALRWRARPARLVAPTDERPVRRGAVRLDRPPAAPVVLVDVDVERGAVARGARERERRVSRRDADAGRRGAAGGGRARRAAGHDHRRLRAAARVPGPVAAVARRPRAPRRDPRAARPRWPRACRAGHGLQVVVEAEPLDVDAELARDWQQIDAAAARTEPHGDRERGEAMRRLGYGLEQTLRRQRRCVQAAAAAHGRSPPAALPAPADWRARLPSLGARACAP